MSFFEVGDKFGVNQANLMKKLGYGDGSDGGINEVRLFKESGSYILKVWNGNEWEVEGAADRLVVNGAVIVNADADRVWFNKNIYCNDKISATTYMNVIFHDNTNSGYVQFYKNDGTRFGHIGSGNGTDEMYIYLDHADKLRVLNGDMIVDEYIKAKGLYGLVNDTHNTNSKFGFESGHDICHSGAATWISRPYNFVTPFTTVPRVVVQHNIINGPVPVVKDITTTGFNCHMYRLSNDATRIDWMAIGGR